MNAKFDLGVPGQERLGGEFFQRAVAKSIDLTVALCLWQIPGAAGFFASVLYLLISDGMMGGRSPGKYLSGLKTVRLDGEPLDHLTSVLRNLPVVIPFFLYPIPSVGHFLAYTIGIAALLLEAYFCLYNEDGMRVGDTVASTGVVFTDDWEVEEPDSM